MRNPSRRVYRTRMRRAGGVFVLMAALALPMAWNTGNQLIYILFGGFLAFLLISFTWVWIAGLHGVTLRRQAPYAVQRGEPFWVNLRIEKRKRVFPAFFVGVENTARPGKPVGFVPVLPRRHAAVLNVREVLARRGVHRLPPYEIVSSFPLGLCQSRCRYEDLLEVVVYPRVYTVRTAALDQFYAGRHTPQTTGGEGDEFFNLREYVPGDDVRKIAWRVSARAGRWIVREMTRSRSRFVVFAIDTRTRRDIESFEVLFEETIELVASLAVTLLRQNYKVALMSPSVALEGGEGTGHELRVLDALARIEADTPDSAPLFDLKSTNPELEWATVVRVSPDPGLWGRFDLRSGGRVLDPREVVYV